jgi:hypothetical protein
VVRFDLKGVTFAQGRYRPLLPRPLAQASGGHEPLAADLTGRFVGSDRSAV